MTQILYLTKMTEELLIQTHILNKCKQYNLIQYYKNLYILKIVNFVYKTMKYITYSQSCNTYCDTLQYFYV